MTRPATRPRRTAPSGPPARLRRRFARVAASTWRFHDAEAVRAARPGRARDHRTAAVSRATAETSVRCSVDLDGRGRARVRTGIGFLDHLLAALAVHGRFDVDLRATGDLEVDQHHTVEDVGLVLGRAFGAALAEGGPIRRTGCFLFPMDEAIGYAAVDLAGRSFLVCELPLAGAFVGELEAALLHDLLLAFARELRAAVHVVVPYGRSDHHRLEAAFKALGKALGEASAPDPRAGSASTKGVRDGR
jgi:imidazoleglycerol-phosphate dehydratase